MSLSSEYRAQFEWRNWPQLLDRLPPLGGQRVLDLGCGAGDLAAELVRRGACVTGLDSNEELLNAALSMRLEGAQFRMHDLRMPLDFVNADGIWSSFVAAFFPDLHTVLRSWSGSLKAGGWIALTEIDDLLGHEPVSERTRTILDEFAQEALAAGLYDFHMGHKLRGHLEKAGFSVVEEFTVEDRELSFQGPAIPEVTQAWRNRFERMPLLRRFCGNDFLRVRSEFLDCLESTDHKSLAKVHCCIAYR